MITSVGPKAGDTAGIIQHKFSGSCRPRRFFQFSNSNSNIPLLVIQKNKGKKKTKHYVRLVSMTGSPWVLLGPGILQRVRILRVLPLQGWGHLTQALNPGLGCRRIFIIEASGAPIRDESERRKIFIILKSASELVWWFFPSHSKLENYTPPPCLVYSSCTITIKYSVWA